MFKKLKQYLTPQMISNALALCLAVAFYLIFSHLKPLWDVVAKRLRVVSPFFYAFALAFILNRPVMRVEHNVFEGVKHSRTWAILVVYSIAFIMLFALFSSILPQVAQSILNITDAIQVFAPKASEWMNRLIAEHHIGQQVAEHLQNLFQRAVNSIAEFSLSIIPGIVNLTVSIGNGLLKIIMVFIISIYMLSGKEKLIFQAKKLVYALFPVKASDRITKIAKLSNRIFSDFLIGKLIDSIIIGILCLFGMLLIYPPYSMLIAMIVMVTNMIPFFGPFLGAIPSIFILLITKPSAALVFAVFILALQQLDGNVIGPKVLGSSLGLDAMWILLGIVIGNGLFGIPGMIIGVPAFAVIYNLGAEWIRDSLKTKGIRIHPKTYEVDLPEPEEPKKKKD